MLDEIGKTDHLRAAIEEENDGRTADRPSFEHNPPDKYVADLERRQPINARNLVSLLTIGYCLNPQLLG